MGPKGSKDKKLLDVAHDKTEILLSDAFKHTNLDFSFKEITTLKVRMKDAENYFLTTFDFLLYYNSYIFDSKLTVLYDNFNQAIEKWIKINCPIFTILIDFDDESEAIEQNQRIDFDSLFTIIFEPLEIKTILYFFMTNCDKRYIEMFFEQLYENIYTHKSTRKYNIMYFLLSNTDFFIRNETYVMYFVNQTNFEDSLNVLDENSFNYRNEFTDAIFLSLYFNQLIKIQYTLHEGNDILKNFIETNLPGFIRSVFKFDLYIEMSDFILNYERELDMLDMISSKSLVNIIHILINSEGSTFGNSYKQIGQEQSMSHRQMYMTNNIYNAGGNSRSANNNMHLMSNRNTFNSEKSDLWAMMSIEDNLKQNLEILLKKIIYSQEKSINEKNVIVIRFQYMYNKNQSFPKNDTISPLISKAKELIISLITDSFAYSTKKRTRKIVIEFYQLDMSSPVTIDNDDKATKEKEKIMNINNIIGHKKYDSNENILMKTTQYYHCVYEKIYFCWFLTKKHISKMKNIIAFIIANKIEDKKSLHNIYEFLFSKSYYLTSMKRIEANLSLFDIEQNFYL